MARLAIAVVGAAAGVGIGVATGGAGFAALAYAGAVGFSLGYTVGGVLFPDQVKQEGSRLGDLMVMSSAFGAVRAIGYGKIRISGNVIWATKIREQKNTTKSGKGSGPSVTSTTYTYFSSFALALCEGPAAAVLRIWADSKLVYDATAGSDTIRRPGFKFRFYPGNETQLPDSIIEADKGVGNVPGYRGTCYLVFDDIPLADYGNRMPNMTVELVFAAAPDYDYVPLVRAAPSIFGSLADKAIAIDLTRGVGYVQGLDPNGIVVFDLATMQTIREVPMTAILADGTDGGIDPYWFGNNNTNLFVGPDGALYFQVGGVYSADRLVRVDANTMRETATFPSHLIATNTTSSFASALYLASLSLYADTGALSNYLVVLGFAGDVGVLFLPAMSYGAGAGLRVSGNGRGAVAGKSALGIGDAWLISQSGLVPPLAHIYLTRVRIGEADSLGSPAGAVVTEMLVLSATAVDPAGIGFDSQAGSLSYDESDDSLLFLCTTYTAPTTLGGVFLVKWSPASGIIFATRMTNFDQGWLALPSRISGGTFAQFSTGDVAMIDSASGAVLLDQATIGSGTLDQWPITSGVGMNQAQVYDSDQQAIYAFVTDNVTTFPAKVRLGRAVGSTTTLGDIVADQCRRAGFINADFDVTALTDVVAGFVVSQRASVVDVLTPLLGAYLVDAVETDYVLRFAHRGGSAVAAVAQDDLIRLNDGAAEPYTETRQQEIELPMRVTLTYTDSDRDFQTNTQTAKRARNPDPTVFSDNQSDVNLAVVMTATPAKQMAEKLIYAAWNERHSFAVRLPPQYAYLDPADPVTLTLADGYTARTRLATTAFGVDYTTDTKLIGETDGQYLSFAAAAAGVPWAASNSISTFGPSRMILLDVPLLRDVDDMGGRAIRAYWAGSSYSTTATWPGAILQTSADTATWISLDATGSEATWGYVETPPADTTATFSVQYSGSLIVGVIGGEMIPASVTDLDLANGFNPMALIKASGEVEIIQYRDVSALGAGRYALSVLRRGQRGTDTMASGHAAGETFVFLDPLTVDGLIAPLAERNINAFYRAVTNGTMAQTAAIQPFTLHGRDLMPYAPVNFVRTASGSPADLILGWQRRTRIGGAMIDGSDSVPLSETSEAYEAYLIASTTALTAFSPTNPATYVRAFTGLTLPTATYTAAMMATDGFAAATDTLHLVVYQLSGVVGRGFRGYQALESDEPGYLEPSAPAPAIPPAVGDFTISGITILDPEGVPWRGLGLNVYDSQVADVVTNDACEPLLTLFPGLKVVRLNNFDYIAPDVPDMLAFVTRLTNKGVVVIAEDHYGISAPPLTGSALATETAWYASWAAYHIDNPRVWFGAPNEPGLQLGGAAITDQQVAVYNAIRATGSTALVGMIPPSGGNPGTVGDGFGLTTSAYATMTRAFWELHFYGWTSDFSTDQAVVDAALAGSVAGGYGIAAVNTIPFADGVGPIFIGEFGISTDGETPDANGDQVLAAVAASGRPWAAWHWYSTAGSDNCTDGAGHITAYGIQIAALIAAG